MPLTTRQLTNTGSPLYTPSGTLITSTAISFILTDLVGNPTDAFDITTGERVIGSVSTTTDNAGIFTVNLWPNDRGDKPTKYICRCAGMPDISSQVPSGQTALTWLSFKTSGQILTPLEVTQLDAHIADATVHLTSAQNALIDSFSAYLTSTEFSYLDGITSNVQAQINTFMSGSVVSINGRAGVVTLTSNDVGLAAADNTSDLNKPISIATQNALDLKAPNISPTLSGNIRAILAGTDNFKIDARTTPRIITLGVLRIEHTAGISGTRPISLDIDSNGFGDTHALVVNYVATGVAAGDENHLFEIFVDTTDSTGGVVQGLVVSKSGTGLAKALAVETLPGVHVIEQNYGTEEAADSNFTFSGAVYTDQTANFNNGNDVQIFVAATDYIYIGHSVKFGIIEVDLHTFASGGGIIPTFEYSDGLNSWALFSPVDGTNGFRQNGNIMIPVQNMAWVTRTVNAVTGKFWIRIRRTNAAVITPPMEHTIHIIVTEIYSWNNAGHVKVSNLNLKNLQTFSNVANAIAGGLVVGDVFRDTQNNLLIV